MLSPTSVSLARDGRHLQVRFEEVERHLVHGNERGPRVSCAALSVEEPGHERTRQGQVGQTEVPDTSEMHADDARIRLLQQGMVGGVLRPLVETVPRTAHELSE